MQLKIASSPLTSKMSRAPRSDGNEGLAANPYSDSFSWVGNPEIQRLLDAISSIIAEEYIEVARNNKEVFVDSRFPPSGTSRGNNGERGQK